MTVTHPTSGETMQVLGILHRLWCFLFGPIYYACKGCWGWAVLSFITLNGLFVGFPLFNKTIIRGHYRKAGWKVGTG